MKINVVPSQQTFKPITLSIDIESKEELYLLKRLFGTDQSVPKLIQEQGYLTVTEQGTLTCLMYDVYKRLPNYD